MHEIKYKIKRLNDKIYLINSNKVDLALLFFRVQEFYEHPKYRNKEVSFWDLFCHFIGKDGIFHMPMIILGSMSQVM